MLLLLLHSVMPIECKDLRDWYLDCTPDVTEYPYEVFCHKNGTFAVNCTVLDNVTCDGDTKVVKYHACVPTEGKSRRIALILSVFLGIFGADRLYLGYISVFMFKFLTGGFFCLGWYLDIFLIMLNGLSPASGDVYKREDGPFLTMRLPLKKFYI